MCGYVLQILDSVCIQLQDKVPGTISKSCWKNVMLLIICFRYILFVFPPSPSLWYACVLNVIHKDYLVCLCACVRLSTHAHTLCFKFCNFTHCRTLYDSLCFAARTNMSFLFAVVIVQSQAWILFWLFALSISKVNQNHVSQNDPLFVVTIICFRFALDCRDEPVLKWSEKNKQTNIKKKSTKIW